MHSETGAQWFRADHLRVLETMFLVPPCGAPNASLAAQRTVLQDGVADWHGAFMKDHKRPHYVPKSLDTIPHR